MVGGVTLKCNFAVCTVSFCKLIPAAPLIKWEIRQKTFDVAFVFT